MNRHNGGTCLSIELSTCNLWQSIHASYIWWTFISLFLGRKVLLDLITLPYRGSFVCCSLLGKSSLIKHDVFCWSLLPSSWILIVCICPVRLFITQASLQVNSFNLLLIYVYRYRVDDTVFTCARLITIILTVTTIFYVLLDFLLEGQFIFLSFESSFQWILSSYHWWVKVGVRITS